MVTRKEYRNLTVGDIYRNCKSVPMLRVRGLWLEEGTVIIFHKYKALHPYHHHGRANTLRQAVWSIRGHGRWQINGRK